MNAEKRYLWKFGWLDLECDTGNMTVETFRKDKLLYLKGLKNVHALWPNYVHWDFRLKK